MLKKLKAKIVRVSILALSFILLFTCCFCLTNKKVHAEPIPLEFIQYEIIDNAHFNDLPYEVQSGSGLGLGQWVFGYYWYDERPCYFLVLYPDYTGNGTPVFYISNTDVNSIDDELIDQEYYSLNSTILSDSCDTIQNIMVHGGFYPGLITNRSYYLQLNYYNFVAVGTYSNYSYYVYRYSVEDADAYNNYFGPLNTAYYQELFYSKICDHVATLGNPVEVQNTYSYQRGVKYGKESQQALVEEYRAMYDRSLARIAQLQQELQSANTDFADFTRLLSSIFMYPIEFFTVGLDVNIFGINLGDFLLGLFMITILLTVFKFILGKRF